MLEFPVLCDQMPYTIVGLPYAAEAATTGTNFDSLVGALVGQMLELQPEGPFRIMGHSLALCFPCRSQGIWKMQATWSKVSFWLIRRGSTRRPRGCIPYL